MPALVYALLTGLNAATVGIIALAAVQLSQKTITDKLTRILVFLGGTAGMLYNALWYFPVLMFAGGMATIFWDYRWPQRFVRCFKLKEDNFVQQDPEASVVGQPAQSASQVHMRRYPARSTDGVQTSNADDGGGEATDNYQRRVPPSSGLRVLLWKFGSVVVACFFITFITVMVLRGVLDDAPRGFSLFANLYLAGKLCLMRLSSDETKPI